MESIVEKKIKQLPPDLHEEVVNFIDFLLTKKVSKRKKKPKLDWIGGLKEYRDQYTALELQKKALEWRD
ncbi:DUF2281 domain-containing protein [Candidatus Poribacteria bacterium]|nr:DUF2281 domain-containing protein [Candidatus Poribacteria bacterium]